MLFSCGALSTENLMSGSKLCLSFPVELAADHAMALGFSTEGAAAQRAAEIPPSARVPSAGVSAAAAPSRDRGVPTARQLELASELVVPKSVFNF